MTYDDYVHENDVLYGPFRLFIKVSAEDVEIWAEPVPDYRPEPPSWLLDAVQRGCETPEASAWAQDQRAAALASGTVAAAATDDLAEFVRTER